MKSYRRPLLLCFIGLCSLGWLWHVAVVGRTAPDTWSAGEYAGSENVLPGWKASVCKNVGLCGNVFGKEKQGKKTKSMNSNLPKAPDFVIDYAPYVYLHSEEKFMPGDIGEHLLHTTPYLNYTPITGTRPLLSNLDDLNKYGDHVYLTSDDDPTSPPAWLRGDRNIPSKAKPGSEEDAGLSSAPGIIVWTKKEAGIVDAFYFYFYSFNLGNTVAGWRFGNHVGDWEHTTVRFIDGQPVSMFFSEHSGGQAYEYAVVEKIGKRPVTYAARGSHANYATPGVHYYAIPFHLLSDHTNKGYLWDPVKNNYLYHYDLATDTLTPDADNACAPLGWFNYQGRWGDRFYPLNDKRQYRVVGQYHFVNGPTGPKFKNLNRTEICQNEGICVVQPSLTYRLKDVKGPWEASQEDKDWIDTILSGTGGDGEVKVEFSGKDAETADVL